MLGAYSSTLSVATAALVERIEACPRFADARIDDLPQVSTTQHEFAAALADARDHGRPVEQLGLLLLGRNAGFLATGREKHANALALALSYELAGVANRLGLYDLSLQVCELTAGLGDSDEQARMSLVKARALRGLGNYEDALTLYRRLLQEVRPNDAFWAARLFILMAKTAHNSQWRIGYYWELLRASRARLERLLEACGEGPAREDIMHELGKCYDGLAVAGVSQAQRREGASAEDLMEKSLTLGMQLNRWHSVLRRKFRRLQMRFSVSTDRMERERIVLQFTELLSELGGGRTDPRGLGVRCRQLADMHLSLDNVDEAAEYVGQALIFARKVSDFRTVVQAHLLGARLHFKCSDRGEFEQQLHQAKQGLDHLHQQHPEIEVEVLRQEARYRRVGGNAEGSLASWLRVIRVLERLEDRVLSDYDRHSAPEVDYCPAERRVLEPQEWGRLTSSLIHDYRLLSQSLKLSLEEAAGAAQHETWALTAEAQLDQQALYHQSVIHRLKNIANMSREAVVGPLDRVALSATDDRLSAILASARQMLRSLEEFHSETSQDLEVMARQVESVDVLRVASALNLSAERWLDPGLRYTAELAPGGRPLLLKCHRPLLHVVLMHLVENAARVARLKRPDATGAICLRVMCEEDSVGGSILVEDNAGSAEDLRLAVRHAQVRADDTTQPFASSLSGLHLALKFFKYFDSDVSVFERDGLTVLRVHLRRNFAFVQ
jgi:tetratricopeptide (TPR) repeat protein